jgi:hypothetical protein
VIAAEHPAAFLQTVPDNAHAAVLAGGREHMDRAFELSKCGSATRLPERLVVIVPQASRRAMVGLATIWQEFRPCRNRTRAVRRHTSASP